MSVRAAFLSAAMLLAISFWGLAVYTESVTAGNGPADGYGVSIGLIATAS